MTSSLFTILAAATLASAGTATTSETRSAQALPVAHLAVAHSSATPARNLHKVNRLADAASEQPGSDQGRSDCLNSGGHWNADKMTCHKGTSLGTVAQIGILAGAGAGVIIATTSNENKSISN